MNNLKELVEIVAQNTQKKIEILDASKLKTRKNSIYAEAISRILSADIKSDEDALTHFKKKGVAYRSFKHRLYARLLNSLFFIDTSKKDISAYTKAQYNCNRMQHIIHILFLFGGRKTAIQITEKTLNMARKFGLSEYAFYCIKTLKHHYAYIGDRYRFEKYCIEYEKWLDRMLSEENAITFLDQIYIHYARSISLKPEIAEDAFRYAKEIKSSLNKHNSFILQYNWHKISGIGFEIAGEYEKSVEIWTSLENYLHRHPLFESAKGYAEVALQKMVNYMHLMQFENGKDCADKCLQYFRPGSNNWLIFLEYYYLLAMQSGNYDDARKIFSLATENDRLDYMPYTSREKWRIFGAYIYYISDSLQASAQNSLKKRFNLSGFLNDLQVYSKDKTGFNVSILIIQICILIKNHDDVKLIERLEALKLYKTRYLGKGLNYRVNVFMELLLNIEKQDKASFLLNKLVTRPISYTNIEGVEVIPFEKLWKMVLKDFKSSQKINALTAY